MQPGGGADDHAGDLAGRAAVRQCRVACAAVDHGTGGRVRWVVVLGGDGARVALGHRCGLVELIVLPALGVSVKLLRQPAEQK